MSDRIRQLEDGLAILQSSVTRDPHPLLATDLLKIKSGLELHSASELELQREREGASGGAGGGSGGGLGGRGGGGGAGEDAEEELAYVDAFGTLAVRDDGAATFYGRSAGSEVRVYSRERCAPLTFRDARVRAPIWICVLALTLYRVYCL